MRLLSLTIGLFAMAFLATSGVAQNNASQNVRQAKMIQSDSNARMSMMQGDSSTMMNRKGMMQKGAMNRKGMMQGGMMSGKGMMQGGMMGGKGMMHGGMMGGKGMMQGGMMENMHSPMHKYMRLVHHLPDWQVRLNLSDKQVNQLKMIRADFLKKQAEWKADMAKKQIDLELLLDKKAPANKIKKQLSAYYDVKVTMLTAAYQTARKMQSLLTAEQLNKLKAGMPMGPKMMNNGR